MRKYKSLTRTTLDKLDNIPFVGVYIIAYFGRVVYVGKASKSIQDRINYHIFRDHKGGQLGIWLCKLRDDFHNIRIDILEPPDDVDTRRWLMDAEANLINRFHPLMNTHLIK